MNNINTKATELFSKFMELVSEIEISNDAGMKKDISIKELSDKLNKSRRKIRKLVKKNFTYLRKLKEITRISKENTRSCLEFSNRLERSIELMEGELGEMSAQINHPYEDHHPHDWSNIEYCDYLKAQEAREEQEIRDAQERIHNSRNIPSREMELEANNAYLLNKVILLEEEMEEMVNPSLREEELEEKNAKLAYELSMLKEEKGTIEARNAVLFINNNDLNADNYEFMIENDKLRRKLAELEGEIRAPEERFLGRRRRRNNPLI